MNGERHGWMFGMVVEEVLLEMKRIGVIRKKNKYSWQSIRNLFHKLRT